MVSVISHSPEAMEPHELEVLLTTSGESPEEPAGRQLRDG
jgi:hypothetical protein